MKKSAVLGVWLVLIGWWLLGCSEDFTDHPHPNQPPETFISIFSDRDLHPTISRQTLHWWGDDPDGMVVGYIYTFKDDAANVTEWDSTAPAPDWIFTTQTTETFTLKLAGSDSVYILRVKAIDDKGLADPTPAVQHFPIINSRPSVTFPVGTDVPESTFTVATFNWSGNDPDGADNIAKYQYVLDDTSIANAWHDLSPSTSSLTLTAADGLNEGRHVFYLRVIDIAGASSPIARMPRQANSVWYVREPKSNFLIIDDYNIADQTAAFYKNILQTIVGAVDVWDIKSKNQSQEPPSAIAFYETLKLFDRIFWYADAEPNLEKAQACIPKFLENGGKIIMSTTFPEFSTNQGDPLDFSPVDSLATKISRITRNQLIDPTSSFSALGFPELKVSGAIIPNVFPLAPKENSNVLYFLPESPGKWTGTPAVAVSDAQSSFVFFGLPLALLDGNSNIHVVFEKILNDLF